MEVTLPERNFAIGLRHEAEKADYGALKQQNAEPMSAIDQSEHAIGALERMIDRQRRGYEPHARPAPPQKGFPSR